jgi:NAD(P) transhydrogenase subunit alpha
MKPGSVIVDLAASNGGNVEGTVPGEKIVTPHGVTIIGYTDLVGRLPAQASQLYGQNLVNLMKLLTPGKDGETVYDLEDVVVRGITVTKGGENLWPPPPVQVSAAPAVKAAEAPAKPEPKAKLTSRGKALLTAVGIAALLFIAASAPPALTGHLMVLVLSVVIGYYVIGNVAHALHTPLMSVTNAISGVIVVGALLQVGSEDVATRALATVAILLASINVFGGFAVTRRMLSMFSKG